MIAAVIIPARWASTRFPGKLLACETGKYLLQHVYEQASQASSVGKVWIAADDPRIAKACKAFGATCVMTDPAHPSGTDRIAEAVRSISADIVVNVQGDEPEISPAHIDRAVAILQQDSQADIATLAARFGPEEDVHNSNVVKVVFSEQGHALYFSRWPIPYRRDNNASTPKTVYYKHIGLYAYRRECLLRLSQIQPTPLEQSERLEQLRALESGMTIAVAEVEHPAVGIDTPEQYQEFVRRYRERMKSRPNQEMSRPEQETLTRSANDGRAF